MVDPSALSTCSAFPPVRRRIVGNDVGCDLDIAQVAELPQFLGGAGVLEDHLVDIEGVELRGSVPVDGVGQTFDESVELFFVIGPDLLSGCPALCLGGHRVRLAAERVGIHCRTSRCRAAGGGTGACDGKISSIRTCQDDIAERARAATPGGRDAQFLDVLFEQPYCRIGTVAERCEVSRQTASSWLHALVAANLLSDIKVGREILFVNHEFLDVLTRPE